LQLTTAEHLTKARQNEAFADSLDTSTTIAVEWVITVKFYAALHYVQAYFASKSSTTPVTHTLRASAIRRDPLISGAYDDYRELSDISREARYGFSNLQAGHITFAENCLASIKSIVGLHL
jgi:uncharacterized membrane protein